MITTLFQYERDDQNRPVFFKSDGVAHFVRGPVPDRTTKPVFFTGVPAARPSYTYLPISTGGGGILPGSFYTLGVPAPEAAPTVALSSGVGVGGTSVNDIEGNLYSNPLVYSGARAEFPMELNTGPVTSNGVDNIIVSAQAAGSLNDPTEFNHASIMLRMRVYRDGSADIIGETVRKHPDLDTDEVNAVIQTTPLLVEVPAIAGSHTYRITIETIVNENQLYGSQVQRSLSAAVAITHKYAAVTVDNALMFSPGDQISISGVVARRNTTEPVYDWMVGNRVVERVEYPHTIYVNSDAANSAELYYKYTQPNTGGVSTAFNKNVGEYISGGTIALDVRGDESAVQDSMWVVTFVTTLGAHDQEGPPSPASDIIPMAPGDSVTLTNLPIAPPDDGGDYRISKKRIYRSSIGTDGIGDFQFVAELPLADTSYTDSKRQVDLGEVLPSLTWIKPPIDMHGLIACHNGMLAGISGNQVCVSVPFQPHAYPITSRFNINDEPVALGSFGETILVMTKGRPVVIVGFDPTSMRVVTVESKFPCMSARGVVDLGDAVVYPSTTSMVLADANGIRLIAGELFEREEWERYKASTIHGTNYNKNYLGFYEDDDGIHGFIFDPYREASSWSDLELSATAACSDPATGEAFIADEDDVIFSFDADAENSLPFHWKSKTFTTQKPWCPAYSRVVAEQYPVNYRLWANKLQPGTIDGVGGATEATMQLIYEREVTSSRPFSLPGDYLATAFEIEVGSIEE